MDLRQCFLPSVLVVIVYSFLSSASFAATGKGKLVTASPQTYKVVAVNKNGSATVASIAASGRFSVKIKKGTTLHLVDSSGRYQGPVVSAKGTKAYASLTGKSGNLGSFALKTGFANGKYNKKSSPFFAAKPKISYNTSTGPRGANKFGFVQVSTSQFDARGASILATDPSEGQDLDKDGLPDLLDIDDDGDLILDIVDQVPHADSEFQGETTSTLRLDLVDSLNVNAGSISDSLIDQLISDHLILSIGVRNNGSKTISSVNVNCQGLTYCDAATGTATIRMDNGPLPEDTLWRTYDPDSDGLPNLQIVEDIIPATIRVRPHATRAQLRTGDTILMSLTTSDNAATSVPAIIPFVFLTGPALKEFTDNGTPTTISYPVSPESSGTEGNAFSLTSGSVSLTFWKPQRKNIEGAETEGYYDMGGLSYGVSLAVGSSVYTCNADEYSNLSSTLTKRTEAVLGTSALRDSALDTPASASNTLSYTIDMATCLSRQGVSTSGAIVTMALEAVSDAQDSTSQFIYFRLP